MTNAFLLGCLFWPLWSALSVGLFGHRLGSYYSGNLAVICLFFTLACSVIGFYSLALTGEYAEISLSLCFNLVEQLEVNASTQYHVEWGLLFDSLTLVMLIVINSISALVHLYATSYMNQDPHQPRFYASLSFFTFFMIVLVTANNYFQLFVGWEGVGLCSYLLISFWYSRLQANKSALQAMVMNKFGDLTLMTGVILLLLNFGTTHFSTIFNQLSELNQLVVWFGPFSFSLAETVGICFFIGAVAKSAQIGLHTWLLSAMEGPTPVSALLHAATMVTAGIFLMIRSSPLWVLTPNTLFLMTTWGAVTAFFAATCGLVQHDIKKVIAFSTCSQLGYMFYACGLGNYTASLYHLTNHAFFKALLFLGAGAVIHALNGEQDFRRMGGLAQLMPVTYTAMFIASLSLMGFPFLSGFYSKDVLIELAWAQYTVPGTFAFWLATLAAFLTAFYSTRLLYFVFLSPTNAHKAVVQHAHEADETMLWSFRPLILGSIFSGYISRDFFIGWGSLSFESARLASDGLTTFAAVDSEFLPFVIKLIPVVFSLLGLIGSFVFYSQTPHVTQFTTQQIFSPTLRSLHFFLVKKWYFDIIYNHYVALTTYRFGYFLYQNSDQGVLEWFGPQGIYQALTAPKVFATPYTVTQQLTFVALGLAFILIFFLLQVDFLMLD